MGLSFHLPGCSPTLLSLRPHGNVSLPLSLHPKWYQALITVDFFFVLIALWSYALIYFIRENLGKKMAFCKANSSLPSGGLGTGGTKGERGLAVPSHLLPVPG